MLISKTVSPISFLLALPFLFTGCWQPIPPPSPSLDTSCLELTSVFINDQMVAIDEDDSVLIEPSGNLTLFGSGHAAKGRQLSTPVIQTERNAVEDYGDSYKLQKNKTISVELVFSILYADKNGKVWAATTANMRKDITARKNLEFDGTIDAPQQRGTYELRGCAVWSDPNDLRVGASSKEDVVFTCKLVVQ